MSYDMLSAHDLKSAMGNRPGMTTDELDEYFSDPAADPDVKRLLLLDVQPQGYVLATAFGRIQKHSIELSGAGARGSIRSPG
jgi:hypothetical protein